ANQQTLEQLTQRNDALETTVQHAQIAADALRAEINGLLTKPQTVVCEAKQQALQLTIDCRAVKTVFGGLSQTSLGATQKIEQITQKIEKLSQMTSTLQQWVGEAVHVQKRLESTVHQAPSIGQTHPPAKLYSLAEPPKRADLGATAPSDGGLLPPGGEREPSVAGSSRKPPATGTDPARASGGSGTRKDAGGRVSPELVARMVADARRKQAQEKELSKAH
ncbi:MAG: hypothetical protein GY842_17525, partial [bacterium]|nr:hypothetical protein [bacterium]